MFLYGPVLVLALAHCCLRQMEGKYPPPPQLVKGTFMGMVYLREELFGGLSQAYNGGVCGVLPGFWRQKLGL